MKVLVPVEDKEYGQHIIDYIVSCKWPADTTLRVFHAVDPSRLNHFAEVSYMELLEKVSAAEHAGAFELVNDIANKLAGALPDNVKVEREFVDGAPKEEILREAKDWPADLIVIGSHGRNAVQRFLLGSVSMSIIGAAPCSVLLVRAKKTAEAEPVAAAGSGKMHVVI